MSEQIEDAKHIAAMLESRGWALAMSMLNEQAESSRQEALDILSKRPEQMTGRKAVSLAAKAGSLYDFRESVEDRVRILVPKAHK